MQLLIADSSPLYRSGIKMVLDQTGIIVKSKEIDNFEALKLTLNSSNDSAMIIIDARLPGLDMQEHFQTLAKRPDVRALVLSGNKDIAFMRWALLNGADGVVAKTSSLDEIGSAIQTVLDGRTWRYEDCAEEEQWIGQTTRLGYALRRLSDQENKVLKHVLCGLRNKQIAHQMSLAEHTIKTHMSNILRKLDIENRTQLVIAIQKIEADNWYLAGR